MSQAKERKNQWLKEYRRKIKKEKSIEESKEKVLIMELSKLKKDEFRLRELERDSERLRKVALDSWYSLYLLEQNDNLRQQTMELRAKASLIKSALYLKNDFPEYDPKQIFYVTFRFSNQIIQTLHTFQKQMKQFKMFKSNIRLLEGTADIKSSLNKQISMKKLNYFKVQSVRIDEEASRFLRIKYSIKEIPFQMLVNLTYGIFTHHDYQSTWSNVHSDIHPDVIHLDLTKEKSMLKYFMDRAAIPVKAVSFTKMKKLKQRGFGYFIYYAYILQQKDNYACITMCPMVFNNFFQEFIPMEQVAFISFRKLNKDKPIVEGIFSCTTQAVTQRIKDFITIVHYLYTF
eukprot:snap_masked-scaffold_2-processed-gene-24.7-mRNA-1 protein AED:1.00 eAED:1.00 QI:0/0/0/0/1/1/2/0/344